MESIVFIDSEITNEGAIADLGAAKETAQFHSANKQEFSEFVKGCDFVCGHNIIHHDLKYILCFIFRPNSYVLKLLNVC